MSDLEELHGGRLDDLNERKPLLRPTDVQNRKTFGANHNSHRIEDLIEEFTHKHSELIGKLESLNDETQLFESKHLRLGIMMKPVDVAYFTAEHDDNHLAHIREILKKNRLKKSFSLFL